MRKRFSLEWLMLLPAAAWFFWSYILTDKALIYSRTGLFLRFQNFMWQWSGNRSLQTAIYLLAVLCLFFVYVFSANIKNKKIWIISCLLFALSNPALSYDLFNYMFDAKMVLVYHLDPHAGRAIDFIAKDDWVQFMRNIFFPTTYGYMWTLLSLVPFVLGLGRLLLVYMAFKLYMLLGLMLLFVSQWRTILPKNRSKLALFFFSPLVLIEVLSSGHNDIWMMLLAFGSLSLLLVPRRKISVALFIRLALSFGLLYASSEIKRATALLIPVWLLLAVSQFTALALISTLKRYWADLAVLLLLAPLLTPLSRQFHPWYLIWALTFIPFVRIKLLKFLLIGLSLTSLLRYLPVIYLGTYSDAIEIVQKTITWSALPLVLVAWYIDHISQIKNKRI